MEARLHATLRAGVCGALALGLMITAALAGAGEGGKVTELLTQPLEDVPGKEVAMITVDFAPGATDPVHRHDASAFVYVLEGTVEMQMEGAEKVTLGPGETFYENPTGVHLVGHNPSDTEPAKLVVFLVKKPGAPLLVPVQR